MFSYIVQKFKNYFQSRFGNIVPYIYMYVYTKFISNWIVVLQYEIYQQNLSRNS